MNVGGWFVIVSPALFAIGSYLTMGNNTPKEFYETWDEDK